MRWRRGNRARDRPTRPLALVYRGSRPVDRACAKAVGELLLASTWDFDVRYVGPFERSRLSGATLDGAALYAQPGGGSLEPTFRRLRRKAPAVRDYVASGGRYLGMCLGGYLAGATPGFDLLPGDTDRYIDLPGAEVRDDGDTVVPVLWRGRRTPVYFQDGPHFVVRPGEVEVVARYTNGAVAALVTRFGSGHVAVVGPHPEATDDWYDDLGLPSRAPEGRALALDLVDGLMRSGEPRRAAGASVSAPRGS